MHILNTNLFDFDTASESAGWLKELQTAEHTPETEEYGISSFVYRRRTPFHPERLAEWFMDCPAEVVRAKGMMWLASRPNHGVSLSQAGPSVQVGTAGQWVCALPQEEQTHYRAEMPELDRNWHPEHGDRLNELVFIGIDMDRQEMEETLDACLLTEAEMQQPADSFNDPFPKHQSELELTV